MPHNGDQSPDSGVYKSVCCGAQIAINAGSPFPDCPNHSKLTTIWKPVTGNKSGEEVKQQSVLDPTIELHVENRRLFSLASGQLRLNQWEHEHLQGCKVCKGVLYVFVNQPIPSSEGRQPKEAA